MNQYQPQVYLNKKIFVFLLILGTPLDHLFCHQYSWEVSWGKFVSIQPCISMEQLQLHFYIFPTYLIKYNIRFNNFFYIWIITSLLFVFLKYLCRRPDCFSDLIVLQLPIIGLFLKIQSTQRCESLLLFTNNLLLNFCILFLS